MGIVDRDGDSSIYGKVSEKSAFCRSMVIALGSPWEATFVEGLCKYKGLAGLAQWIRSA